MYELIQVTENCCYFDCPAKIGLESTIVDFTEDVPVILRPGYLGLNKLREILGEVKMDPGLLSEADAHTPPKAPGRSRITAAGNRWSRLSHICKIPGTEKNIRTEFKRQFCPES